MGGRLGRAEGGSSRQEALDAGSGLELHHVGPVG